MQGQFVQFICLGLSSWTEVVSCFIFVQKQSLGRKFKIGALEDAPKGLYRQNNIRMMFKYL